MIYHSRHEGKTLHLALDFRGARFFFAFRDEGDGFAAGVRTGENDAAKGGVELEGVADDGVGAEREGGVLLGPE